MPMIQEKPINALQAIVQTYFSPITSQYAKVRETGAGSEGGKTRTPPLCQIVIGFVVETVASSFCSTRDLNGIAIYLIGLGWH